MIGLMKMSLAAVVTSPAPTECAVVRTAPDAGPVISEVEFTSKTLLRLKVKNDLLSLR